MMTPRFARLAGPAAMLMLLLQRTPLLRVVVSAEFGAGVRLGQMLRAAFPVIAGVVTVNTLTGATRFTANPVSPASATVGTAFSVAFAVTGAPSTPKSYTVTGLPAGLNVPSGTLSSTTWTVNSSTGSIAGTPTTAGNFTVSIRAYANTNGGGDRSPIYSYVINVTGSANAPPAFTTQPASQTVTAGGSVSFTVAASGTPVPTLQWRKGGANLAGQTSATLSLTSVTAADAGSYDCVATNTAGTATSTAVTLAVNTANVAPSFTTQPTSQSVAAGGSVSFTVAASGTPAPTLQWRKNSVNLAGQTGATLSLTNVAAGDAGSYTCVATNAVGAVTSSAATLTVAAPAPPTIAVQPVPMTSLAGSGAYFAVRATGSGLTYQWFKNGVAIAGATQSSLLFSGVQAANAGNYSVSVADSFGGQATSNTAALAVVDSGAARLINMSARAGVGTGADVLIPGFVIQGDVALTLLIRGVGPQLAAMGVPATLSDPVMSLFSGQSMITTNDDWEQSPDLTALTAATGAVSAFPLAAGSKDSAMLVTLNPGIYTVQINGKNGLTGVALVELYVVGP